MMWRSMPIAAKPPAEVTIDRSVIGALLQEQHNDLAHLPLTEIAEGWDNKLFRWATTLWCVYLVVPLRPFSSKMSNAGFLCLRLDCPSQFLCRSV